MQFTTIQDHKTKEIIKYIVDKKEVSRNKFLHLEHIQQLKGRKYNSSFTITLENGNFKHSASL